MSFLMIKLERLKNKTVVLVLTLFLFTHELACLAGFFVLPFIRYPEKARNIWLIVWFYIAIVFALDMIYGIYKQCHEKEKEIQKYQQDKVYYWALNVGIVFFVCIAFLFVFLVRNQYLILTWSQISGGVLVGITIFMLVMVMLLLYKGKYKSMFRDLAVVWGLLVCLCLLVMGVLLASDEKYKTASQVLILVGAIPLCLWGIKTFCKMFLSNKNIAKDEDTFAFAIFISLCIAVVFGVMVYYLIADKDLRDIMGNMLAATLGGFITLVGVAWTIKDGNEKRQADIKRIEDERKEEERKKLIPYVMLSLPTKSYSSIAQIDKKRMFDFTKAEDIQKIENETYYVIFFRQFFVRNISSSNLILKGVFLDEEFYPFVRNVLVESNGICCVFPGDETWMVFHKKINSVKILVSDIMETQYVIDSQFSREMEHPPRNDGVDRNGVEYRACSYTYEIKGVDLPQLREEN